MKRIGIVTFFKANNYGVCLQAIATSEFLKRQGYEVDIINYINPYEHRIFKWSYKENDKIIGYVTSLMKNILLGKKKYYNKGFKNVENYYHLTERCATKIEQVQDMKYDILIAGSDQIWNPLITGGIDPVFLLQFGKAERRISVASSLGSKEPTETENNIFKEAFKKFSYISVREQYAKKCLQDLTDKKIKVLMDPTFLFNKKEWVDLLGKKSKAFDIKEKYILTYFISSKKSSYQDRVLEYSKKFNCPVWSIQFTNYTWKVTNKKIMGASIEDFIALFMNAQLILTDSFHGTAFSINLNRNFVPFKHSENPLRIVNLLQNLGIAERLDMPAEGYKEINYDEVNNKLEVLREDSKEWLLNAVEFE
jgi:putative sterol carrier protein